jgi:hypothetical protein
VNLRVVEKEDLPFVPDCFNNPNFSGEYDPPDEQHTSARDFTKEGILRREMFVRGKWADFCRYSILREEWTEPKTLTRTT